MPTLLINGPIIASSDLFLSTSRATVLSTPSACGRPGRHGERERHRNRSPPHRGLQHKESPMRRHHLLFVIALLLPGLPGTGSALAADSHPIDTALQSCMDHNSTTVGMRQCQAQALADWDAALNTAYTQLMASQSPEAKTALRTAQRQWIAFRDAQIAYFKTVFDKMDGTIWPMIELQYSTDLSRKRAIQLYCYTKMTNLAAEPDPLCQ